MKVSPLLALAVSMAAAVWLLGSAPPEKPMLLHPTLPSEETRCGKCHTEDGWSKVKFAHERTGFPLLGKHKLATCKGCHGTDYRKPQPRNCSGCHVDPHTGSLGERCQECHDEESWKSRFDAFAHRRTAFPLIGRHASLPCNECHGPAEANRFNRKPSECAQCHVKDYERTFGTRFDHPSLGFSMNCKQCHGPFRFTGAVIPGHDACFPISKGTHLWIRCEHCHTRLPAIDAPRTCGSGTASCISCHSHACGESDKQHKRVQGYQCVDSACYACHPAGKKK